MAQSSMMHIRIDNQLKNDAAAALAAHGLTISDAVRITLTRVVKEGGLPANLVTDTASYDAWFKAKVYEAISDTRSVSHEEAMNEVQNLINRKRHA
ncbi:type II toxin-antitoxin system RelB/DinJ family antitoxin [Salmonella enterica]|uniref:Type II toxin-antitoxin system RelB/DinJ family antitoxin n=1 Tax=Salmonella enterica TaxID=28901 RepID=A0A5T8T7H8_SALER|nr:type II toxin-antitoxin system RelB/DinJ family antitoxin [Salmonella enterica]EBF7359320.1 type II toxin-antitoxin system RelB/DinJ family antitoxin [Salmonella enterica subsp. enterica serovar Edinburgh]EBH8903779.1 type II toxin-antitoxin system RelB/DinJ family antitoxin [Salmonella enterica subsp. enterica serovar 6,7:b:-]ECO1388306.1 type II toxin-antitoxin system RelB/DinJ family antitoxin [Salmonella enterica subsp. enterica serovar Give]EDC8051881.1 type II toxin-antitoxin system Re